MTSTSTASVKVERGRCGAPLKRNFAWTLAGNLTYAGCQWGFVLVLSRLGNPEMLGEVALGLAIASPVFLMSQLQLRSLQATDASHAEYRPGDYLALRIVMTVLALAVIAGVIIFGRYRGETALVILAVAAAKACDSLSDVFYGQLQQYEDMPRIARSMIMRGLLSVCALGITVWATHSAVWGAIAWACTWAVVLILYDARSTEVVSTQLAWNWLAMRRLAIAAFPLGVVMMFASLDVNIPRYVIEHDLGAGALGLFAGVASLQAAGNVLVNAMGQTASPRLARYHFLRDYRSFRSLVRKLVAIAVLPGLCLVGLALVAGDAVPRLLFGPAFAHQGVLFLWLSFSLTIWLIVSVLGYAATAMRRIRFQPYVLGAVAVTTWVVCSFAIPRYGISGAAISATISAAVACVLFTLGLFFTSQGSEAATDD